MAKPGFLYEKRKPYNLAHVGDKAQNLTFDTKVHF